MYDELIEEITRIPPETRSDIKLLAAEISGRAFLPVIGAGGSIACGAPSVGDLTERLSDKISEIDPKPALSDLDAVRKDLGKAADVVAITESPEAVPIAMGFRDTDLWPSARTVFERYARSAHPCAYRVLARMAKERFLSESVTFNYDCHFEGALMKEAFFPRRTSHHSRWPEIYTVVSNAKTNASVDRRGELVLNKVHGCVEAWRETEKANPGASAEGMIIRWSQLLDWRQDRWSRDLFRDRARRHILLLVGFSGVDPVIHSTMQAVMREVAGDVPLTGPSRIRAVDTDPNKLTLQMLVRAGIGDQPDVRTIKVHLEQKSGLAATLLALHSDVAERRLREFARERGTAAPIPASPEAVIRRLAVSGPAMLRWTWATLATCLGETGFAGLRDLRDDYYVPLLADPERTLIAFDVREAVAALFAVAADERGYGSLGSFVVAPRAGIALMPTGLRPHEVDALAGSSPSDIRVIDPGLTSPAGSVDRMLVGRDSNGALRGFSLERGVGVAL